MIRTHPVFFLSRNLLFCVFQRFAKRNFLYFSILQERNNCISANPQYHHLYKNIKRNIIFQPARIGCKDLNANIFHDKMTNRNRQNHGSDYNNRSWQNVKPIDFRIAIAQNLCHGNGLCILFNDNFRQQVDNQPEHDNSKNLEDCHHVTHGNFQLTRSLCHIIYSNDSCNV